VKVVLFGATGMIGSGALIECLEHPAITTVLSVGRRPCGRTHEKLVELEHRDFLDFMPAVEVFSGYDACLYCVGISSAGIGEAEYRRVTLDMTIAAAEAMLSANPQSTFCFVSGLGADSSERGRIMWARVKGATENRLVGMTFGHLWIFRPGYVQPAKGVRSRSRIYNVAHAITGPLFPLLSAVAPGSVTTTERVGLALIRAAREGAAREIVGNADINALAGAERARLGV